MSISVYRDQTTHASTYINVTETAKTVKKLRFIPYDGGPTMIDPHSSYRTK